MIGSVHDRRKGGGGGGEVLFTSAFLFEDWLCVFGNIVNSLNTVVRAMALWFALGHMTGDSS